MPTITPTQLTLRELRRRGYKPVQVVERWNQFAGIRQDLFGFIDILALKGEETLSVQTTTATNMAAHRDKITEHENLPYVRDANWTVLLHGWRKKGTLWVVNEEDLS